MAALVAETNSLIEKSVLSGVTARGNVVFAEYGSRSFTDGKYGVSWKRNGKGVMFASCDDFPLSETGASTTDWTFAMLSRVGARNLQIGKRHLLIYHLSGSTLYV